MPTLPPHRPPTIAGLLVAAEEASQQGGPPRHLGTSAIELAQPGDVIVVEQRTGRDAGCWGGILTLGDVAQTHSVSLALLGQYAAASDFAVASDGHGGTLVTLADPSQNHALTLANSSH